MFSQASTDPRLSDKNIFTTLVRMGPPFTKMGRAITQLFKYFEWTRVVMVSRLSVGQRFVFCDYASRSIEKMFRTNNISIEDWMKFSDGLSETEIKSILERIKYRGRSK